MVIDDENRENEGDMIFAAGLATAELTAFMIRLHVGIYLCRNDRTRFGSTRPTAHGSGQ